MFGVAPPGGGSTVRLTGRDAALPNVRISADPYVACHVNSRLLGCRTSVGRHPSHISRPITSEHARTRANTQVNKQDRAVTSCTRRTAGLFVPKPSRRIDCQRRIMPDLERSSVSVRWRPLLALAIVPHLVTRLRASFGLATWMRTTGACLVVVSQYSPARVQTVAQDSHSAHGLLYHAAVQRSSQSAAMIRRDIQPRHYLHHVADLLKYPSMTRSRRRC